jgi:hypothetical protein
MSKFACVTACCKVHGVGKVVRCAQCSHAFRHVQESILWTLRDHECSTEDGARSSKKLLYGSVDIACTDERTFACVGSVPRKSLTSRNLAIVPSDWLFHRNRAHLENTSGAFRLIRLQQCSRRAEKESHSIQYYAAHTKKYLIGVRQRPSQLSAANRTEC